MIYERIVKEIERQGLRIASVEKAAGLGNTTIRNWVTASPRVNNLQAVCDVLGIDICDVLKKDEPKIPEAEDHDLD